MAKVRIHRLKLDRIAPYATILICGNQKATKTKLICDILNESSAEFRSNSVVIGSNEEQLMPYRTAVPTVSLESVYHEGLLGDFFMNPKPGAIIFDNSISQYSLASARLTFLLTNCRHYNKMLIISTGMADFIDQHQFDFYFMTQTRSVDRIRSYYDVCQYVSVLALRKIFEATTEYAFVVLYDITSDKVDHVYCFGVNAEAADSESESELELEYTTYTPDNSIYQLILKLRQTICY